MLRLPFAARSARSLVIGTRALSISRTSSRRPSAPPPRRREEDDDEAVADEYDDEYYVDFEEEDGDNGVRHARFVLEHQATRHIPHALDTALSIHTLPELRRLKDAPEDSPPTVHHFAAYRLDLAYAACHRVLHEVRMRRPGHSFRRALDFGAGLSPLSWALNELWRDDDAAPETLAVEPNSKLRDLGSRLTTEGGLGIHWAGALPAAHEHEPFDLVGSTYALGPLTDEARQSAIHTLWQRTAPGGMLLLIEPATVDGFNTILGAREQLTGGGGTQLADDAAGALHPSDRGEIVAPCPHAQSCPLAPGSGKLLPWMRADKRTRSLVCHTSQLVNESCARAYLQRRQRRGRERRRKNESFCYLVVRRPATQDGASAAAERAVDDASQPDEDGDAGGWARVIRQPRKRGGHVLLDICQPSGSAVSGTVTRRKTDHRYYRLARKARQGDTFFAFDETQLEGVHSDLVMPTYKPARKALSTASAEPSVAKDAALLESPEQLRRELQKAVDAGLVYDPKAASRPRDEPDEPDEVGEDDDECVEEYYYDEGEGEPGPK